MNNAQKAAGNRYSAVRTIPLGVVNLHFLSGVTAGDDAPYDVAAQTRIVFARIAQVLEGVGARLEDVVKITVFLSDIREYGSYNEVRNEVFALIDPPPASSGVEALLASPGKRVEIEAIAVSRQHVETR